MKSESKSFVVATKDTITPDETVIELGDVGVLLSASTNHSEVFFIRVWKKAQVAKDDIEVIDVKKTGDQFDKKICNVCHKLKETTNFDRNQNGVNNRQVRRPSCRECRRIIDGVKLTAAERRKWSKLKPRSDAYECPICKKRTIAGVTSKIVLEHDHRTGKAGGWICDSCNTGLGRFKDDVNLLKSAIKFLEKSY